MRQAEIAQEPPDRDAVDGDAVAIRQLGHQIVERQVRCLRHTRLDPVPHVGQFAMSAAIALCFWLKATCRAFQDDHVIDETHRNPEPRRGRSMRMTLFDTRNNPLPNLARMWSAHPKPPYLPCRQGITDRPSGESRIGKPTTRSSPLITRPPEVSHAMCGPVFISADERAILTRPTTLSCHSGLRIRAPRCGLRLRRSAILR
jgi:hypothetical protein